MGILSFDIPVDLSCIVSFLSLVTLSYEQLETQSKEHDLDLWPSI